MRSMKIYNALTFARELGVSRMTICQLIQAGDIKAEKLGKTWVIQDSELRKWHKIPNKLTHCLVKKKPRKK